jgi:ElaB/YqjD/DUF883 family membrane-anchored ribosome-binding protein
LSDLIKNTLLGKIQQQFKPAETKEASQEVKDSVTKGSNGPSLSDINALANFAKTKGLGDLLGGLTGGNQKMDQVFQSAEKAIEGSKSGDIQKEASGVTKNLLSSIQEYAHSTGKKVEDVTKDVEKYAVSHPAVSITVLLGAGITVGALLQHYNIPGNLLSGAEGSLSAIGQKIKDHPFIAAGIGVGLAGGLAYLVNLALTSPAFKPPVADTPQKQKLSQSLDNLEKEVSSSTAGNPAEASKGVAKKFFDTVSEYAKTAGKAAGDVATDVKNFMLSHPGVTAAVILGAGVTTGVLLEKAGVPEKTAFYAGLAFDSACAGARKGLGEVSELIKGNPVLSGVIITALAAGAGYLVYNYVSGNKG